MTLVQLESKVLEIAREYLGDDVALEMTTRMDDVFSDSLEFLDYATRLQELGELSQEALSRAETFGDLANALSNPN